MQLITTCKNNTLYVTLRGELDEHTAGKTRREADALAEKYTFCNEVVFDLGEMSFMDSTGIGFLIGRYKTFLRYGVPCYIGNVSLPVDKILTISGIYSLMPKR